MRISLRGFRFPVVLVLTSALAACSDGSAPTAVRPESDPRVIAPSLPAAASINAAGSSLLACPATVTQKASAVIGRKGGILRVDGSALVVPPNAVQRATRFTFTVPASPYVEVDVIAHGYDHFTFQRPVAISVSYARCPDSALPATSLDAWWIDPGTRAALGMMVGVDDREGKRLTFITDHLSGYAVVYRSGREEAPLER